MCNFKNRKKNCKIPTVEISSLLNPDHKKEELGNGKSTRSIKDLDIIEKPKDFQYYKPQHQAIKSVIHEKEFKRDELGNTFNKLLENENDLKSIDLQG